MYHWTKENISITLINRIVRIKKANDWTIENKELQVNIFYQMVLCPWLTVWSIFVLKRPVIDLNYWKIKQKYCKYLQETYYI